MKLSIASTLYLSQGYVEEFHQRVMGVTGQLTEDVELIVVNDSSPDDSLGIAVKLLRTLATLQRKF